MITPALVGADIPIPGTTWAMAAGDDAPAVAWGMRHAPVAVDIETFGLGPLAWQIKCVVFSDGHTCAVLDPRDPKHAEVCKEILSTAPELIFWNSAFDVPILYNNGLLPYNVIDRVTDPLLHARLAEPDNFIPKSLEAVGDRLGVMQKGKPISQTFKELGLKKTDGFYRFDLNVVSYLYGAAMDGLVTHRLAPLVREAAKKQLLSNPFTTFKVTGSELERLLDREQVVNRVLLRRACKGIQVDFEFAEQYRRDNGENIANLETQLRDLGIKPGDGPSLLKWLDGYGLLTKEHPRTPTGKLQSTAAVLESLDHPVARTFVEHKQLVKVDRDYLSKLEDLSKPTGGRIHPQTNLLAAVTGRMSVSNPPLQQMPPAARAILMADEGREFTSIDYSQVEPFLVANISGDLQVLKGYESGTSDLYTDLAAFSEARGTLMPRKMAKETLLAQLYGQGLPLLTERLGLDPGSMVEREDGTWTYTFDEARGLRDRVFEVMPATAALIENIKNAAKRSRCVPTLSGRVVPVPVYVNKKTGKKDDVAAYKGVNYHVQGGAYDLLAEAIWQIHREGLSDAVSLAVHDELVVDTEAANDIERIMRKPCDALIRVSGREPRVQTERKDLGRSWGK